VWDTSVKFSTFPKYVTLSKTICRFRCMWHEGQIYFRTESLTKTSTSSLFKSLTPISSSPNRQKGEGRLPLRAEVISVHPLSYRRSEVEGFISSFYTPFTRTILTQTIIPHGGYMILSVTGTHVTCSCSEMRVFWLLLLCQISVWAL